MSRQTTPPPLFGTVAWLRWFRSQAEWKRLRRQVVTEEPVCWLRLPGCTIVSTTADHVIPASQRPELAHTRSNVRGACHNCNSRRSDKRPFDPDLRRPANSPVTLTTTPVALRRSKAHRRQPAAIQFFLPNKSNNGANNGRKNGTNNGRIGANNGRTTPKQWPPQFTNSRPIRTDPTKTMVGRSKTIPK